MSSRDQTCCTGFSRAQLLRQGAAQAGRGLPSIEPGMPLPAGTGLSRRSFLARSLGMTMAVYGGSALGPKVFEEGIAHAAGTAGSPVFVSISLPGGIDSLTLLAPTEDPLYQAARPTLKVAPGSGILFAEDDRLRWHTTAAPLATLHGEGKVVVLPGVGYSGPNQSHFTSRHFWEVGSTDPVARLGWMGRYLDLYGDADNPLQGLSLANSLSPSLAPARVPVAAVSRPDLYTFGVPGVEDPIQDPTLAAFGALGALPGGNTARDQARRAAEWTADLRAQLAPMQGNLASPVSYPAGSGDFGRRLAGLSKMLADGLPVSFAAIDAPGSWDTHANQAATLPSILQVVADTVFSFQRDLEARGVADRVITLVWSEFGRRVKQNGSGTDHGAAGAALLMGTRVNGTMVGEFPGLSQLDSLGNLRATSDFRGLYCSVLEQWFGVDAAPVIPDATALPRYQLLA